MSKTKSTSSNLDIKISEHSHNEFDGLNASYLSLDFEGDDNNVKLINALRRVSMKDLPMYGFCDKNIIIEKNTCQAFNNDMMRQRLSILPVRGVKPDIFYLNEKYWENVNYADLEREHHPSEKKVEVYINHYNNTNNTVSITTNDISMYVDGERLDNPYNHKYPFLIIKLRPEEEFKCSMKASLGVGDRHMTWRGACNAYHVEIDKNINKYRLFIESNWQIEEYELLMYACKYLMKKMDDLKSNLGSKIESKEIQNEYNIITLTLEKEDHTIGELINYEFQNHNDIIGSGVGRKDLLLKTMTLTVIGEENPINPMLECLDLVKDKLTNILNQLEILSKKT